MTDEPTNIFTDAEAVAPAKKPYVKPQLHVLSNKSADGKYYTQGYEGGSRFGPS